MRFLQKGCGRVEEQERTFTRARLGLNCADCTALLSASSKRGTLKTPAAC
jgi:hypothetical protein